MVTKMIIENNKIKLQMDEEALNYTKEFSPFGERHGDEYIRSYDRSVDYIEGLEDVLSWALGEHIRIQSRTESDKNLHYCHGTKSDIIFKLLVYCSVTTYLRRYNNLDSINCFNLEAYVNDIYHSEYQPLLRNFLNSVLY